MAEGWSMARQTEAMHPGKQSMKNLFAMSTRMLWRDWRGGELRILAIALVIAVTSVTSVGFFIDRVQQGMDQQASELIAADLVVSSASPVAGDRSDRAEALGLEIAETTSFRSVIIAGDQPKLVEAKAVSEHYPLRGALSISDALFGEEYQVETVPAPGEAWAEPKLFQELGLSPGDRVTLGEVTLTLTHILTYEPDRGGDFFSVAPRLLFNIGNLDATGLVQTGSLIRYHLLLGGEPARIRDYADWLDRNPREGERLLTVEGGRPELRNALERARSFLGLAALVSVLLAGVAVATAARRFSQRHLDTSAIMRCMGATQNSISLLFLLEMLWLALLASTLGVLLGYFAQIVIAQIMDQLLITALPQPSLKPLLLGYVTGIILLIGFAMPPLLALKRVPPLRVLRKDIAGTGASSWLFTLGVLVSMGVLLYWQTQDPELVVYMLSGIVLTLLLLAVCARLLIASLNSIRGSVGVAWRFGLANIARRPSGSVMQIVAFGLGIMVLLLLSTVRNDLLDDWQRWACPAEAAVERLDLPDDLVFPILLRADLPLPALPVVGGRAAEELLVGGGRAVLVNGGDGRVVGRPDPDLPELRSLDHVFPPLAAAVRGARRLDRHRDGLTIAHDLELDHVVRARAAAPLPATAPPRAQRGRGRRAPAGDSGSECSRSCRRRRAHERNRWSC